MQHPTTQFFTGWMPFLPPNQQRQSTECTSTEGTQTMKQISKNCRIILKKYITTSIILAFKIHHTIYKVSNTATLASSIFFNK